MNRFYLVLAMAILSGTVSATDQPIDKSAANLAKAISACGHNDDSSVFRFDPTTFNARKILADIKAEDNDRGCRAEERYYSSSKQVAVENALAYIDHDDCFDENVSKSNVRKLRKLLNDPSNLGVFSTENLRTSENSESCAYSHFIVYTKNGHVYYFKFDYTD